MLDRIRRARPDLLFVAFGQPKGERWIMRHFEALGVPVSVQVGASLDFAAGRIRRAPRWMQNAGLEWAFRLALEPRRLVGTLRPKCLVHRPQGRARSRRWAVVRMSPTARPRPTHSPGSDLIRISMWIRPPDRQIW